MVWVALFAALIALCGSSGRQHRPESLPGRLTSVWSAETSADFDSSAKLIVIKERAIVAPAPDGALTVRDPRSGRIEQTITADPGWNFDAVEVLDDRLYTAATSELGPGVDRFAAYDLRTGQIVWSTDLRIGVSLQPMLVTSRGIVAQGYEARVLYGLRLTDGKIGWQTELPAACSDGAATSTPTAAVFLFHCAGTEARLFSVDPAGGRVSWQRLLATDPAGVDGIDLLATRNGDVLAQAGTTLRLFAPNGRLIFTAPSGMTCGGACAIGENGSDIAISLQDGAHALSLLDIDASTGRLRWQRNGDLITWHHPVLPIGSGGILYAPAGSAVVKDRSQFLPSFIVALRTDTGRSTVFPLPTTDSIAMGNAAGLVFFWSPGPRNPVITAYRGDGAPMAQTELGGVRASDWPDACTLLTPADLRIIAHGYVSTPRKAALADVTWPKPLTCVYVGPERKDPVVTLSIAWIAASQQQADMLVATKLAAFHTYTYGETQRIAGGYLVPDDTLAGRRDRAMIVGGRAIVWLTVPGHPEDARRLAPIVAARLSNAYG
ncbi:outer membrane protein assembly factor BamB family protein [Actinoallomurus rhizosphaericola]|uniref:outer membrane protein assembly factor BamB family protein n=1 Tax=Actinoallomurus rhizosphaericola TaxID=2952536 RepID=UPI002091969C|nr:PQQ-binding-like beta-propeller repeat protein [Actinoallomurus rhizosphaericola]MCO5993323.1 PQQ-like beta-propeller repeat protein [Actinoallomurus rhizosphaericola]